MNGRTTDDNGRLSIKPLTHAHTHARARKHLYWNVVRCRPSSVDAKHLAAVRRRAKLREMAEAYDAQRDADEQGQP